MCKALEEWEEKIRQEGRQEGIRANIRTCKKFNVSQDSAIKNLMEEFYLPEKNAAEYVKQYW